MAGCVASNHWMQWLRRQTFSAVTVSYIFSILPTVYITYIHSFLKPQANRAEPTSAQEGQTFFRGS